MGIAPIVDTDAGLADMLNLATLIEPGIVLCKDGSLIAGWSVEGRDSTGWSEAEEAHRADQINEAFVRLGGGWMIHYDVVATKSHEYADADADAFPDEFTQRIDDERREVFQSNDFLTLDRRQVMLLTYTPDSAAYRKSAALFFDDEGAGKHRSPVALMREEIAFFKAKVSEFENTIRGQATLGRLTQYEKDDAEPDETFDDLVNYLDFRISGRMREVAIRDEDFYLDGLLALDYWDTAHPIKFGNEYIFCVCLDGFPAIAHPGILDGLARLKCEYVWSQRFIMRERSSALRDIASHEKSWGIRVKGFARWAMRMEGGHQNRDALNMQLDTHDAEERVSSGKVAQGYFTSVIVFRGKDVRKLEKLVEYATEKAALADAKFNLRLETWNAPDAWLGTIAGHVHNVRKPPLNTRNFTDLISWSTLWRGPAKHPNPMYQDDANSLFYALTRDGMPFRFNPFQSDVGNIIWFGPIGSGKTAVLNESAAQDMRYPGMRVWSLDYKFGMYRLAVSAGWRHYDLGDPAQASFCPLGALETEEDVSAAKTWIEHRFESRRERNPTARQGLEIHKAIELMRELPELRSLSDFCAFVQDAEVRDTIKHFTIDGKAGGLLDAQEDTLDPHANAVFECEQFVHSVDKTIAGAVYSHLFRKFYKGLRVDRPSSFYMDEAHWGWRDKHLCADLETLCRTIRSRNGRITFATQSIREAVDNDMGPLLLESCPTIGYLANPNAGNQGTDKHPGPYDYYRMLGLTDDDIGIVASMKAKREYYVVCPEGRQVIDLGLTQTVLDLIQPIDVDEVRRLRA